MSLSAQTVNFIPIGTIDRYLKNAVETGNTNICFHLLENTIWMKSRLIKRNKKRLLKIFNFFLFWSLMDGVDLSKSRVLEIRMRLLVAS